MELEREVRHEAPALAEEEQRQQPGERQE